MIYHVLAGDSLIGEFNKTGLDGEVVVCREALVAGPIDAENLEEFWNQRAHFILTEYGEDEIEYHEKVASELAGLAEVAEGDEVNLWFEYELFCSANMWFCLSLLAETNAEIYRVEPLGLDEANRWEGFGKFSAADLRACHALRSHFSPDDVKLGASLWRAYARNDHETLSGLARQECECLPHLKEVVAAALVQDIQPKETLRAILARGVNDIETVIAEFKKREGIYGYGDLQVQRLLDQISS